MSSEFKETLYVEILASLTTMLQPGYSIFKMAVKNEGKSVDILACWTPLVASFPVPEPVGFQHPGLSNKTQVNSTLQPWKQAKQVAQ